MKRNLVGCSDDPIVKLYDLRYCSVNNNTINNTGINNNDNKTTLQGMLRIIYCLQKLLNLVN